LSSMKYRFIKSRTIEALLKLIGVTDFPSTKVSMAQPAIDEKTGELVADLEIDTGELELTSEQQKKLKSIMKALGFEFKEKV